MGETWRQGEGDDTCSCGPCTTRRWIYAWANGETERRPEDREIRWYLRSLIANKAASARRRERRDP